MFRWIPSGSFSTLNSGQLVLRAHKMQNFAYNQNQPIYLIDIVFQMSLISYLSYLQFNIQNCQKEKQKVNLKLKQLTIKLKWGKLIFRSNFSLSSSLSSSCKKEKLQQVCTVFAFNICFSVLHFPINLLFYFPSSSLRNQIKKKIIFWLFNLDSDV